MNKQVYGLGRQALPRVLALRKGTVLGILGAILLVLIMLVWLVFASFGWLANRLPTVVQDTLPQNISPQIQDVIRDGVQQGSDLLGAVGINLPAVTEGLKDIGKQAGSLAGIDPAVVDRTVDSVAEKTGLLGNSAPVVIPAADVPGDDLLPFARMPGLVRESFAADKQVVVSRFIGKQDFEAVTTYYIEQFFQQGFRQQIITASERRQSYRFTPADPLTDSRVFELEFARAGADAVQVTVTVPAISSR